MPINVTPDIVQQYARNQIKYSAYEETVELYDKLRVHANGEMPEKIIEERRPSESERIKEYRKDIYVPITESTVSKVITSLSKIRRSADWSIDYDPEAIPAIVSEDETLQSYCEVKYPYFRSVTNWSFSVLLKNYLIDANALQLIMPINLDKAQNEYYRPFSYIYNSTRVLDYKQEDYAVLLSEDQYTYMDKDGAYRTDGVIIFIADTIAIQKWVQVEYSGRMALQYYWPHNLGFLPVRKLGGVFFKAKNDVFIYKSRIQSTVPRLDEAARIYSDLQAEIVQHVHSEKWIYIQTECRHCNGTGRVVKDNCDCHKCEGRGYVNTSPYSNLVLTPPNNVQTQQPIPTPPAGYIQKSDVALMVDRINNLVNEQIYAALSAINMEFLATTPLNQSGLAKEVDKDELNNFVHSVAEDIVAQMDWTYYVTNEYRYKDVVSSEKERVAMLPRIPVPEKFDLLSSAYLLDELAKAKQNSINPVIMNELQIEYASKKFYNSPRVKDELETVFELDPFPSITEEEKMVRLQNGGITKLDYIISANIQQFVRKAMEEDPQFASKPLLDRRKIIEQYAEEVEESNSVKASIDIPVDVTTNGDTETDPTGNQ